MRVTLNGEVIADDLKWLYDYFGIPAICPGAVRQALRENPEGEDLVLEVNSIGGSVFAGFEIYTLLRGAECSTVAEVQSLAASAASTIVSGCGRVVMSPVAQIMLHQPAVFTSGNIDEHDRSLRMLESIQRSIINGYAARCGEKTTRRHLENLVNQETWLTAQEAVEIGLADEIIGESAPTGTVGVMSVMNAAGGIHDAAELLARYEEAVRSGAAPAEGHPVTAAENPVVTPAGDSPADKMENWRRQARLAIEKNRFI